MRVTMVGSGFVGATAAMRVVQKGLADDVVMIDIVEGLPQGLALDMRQSAPIEAFEPNIRGTNDYADTGGSDVVVITAGLPRQPGMSRMDLLDKNAGIVRDVVGRVAEHSPQAILIVVTNPLDEMTFLASEVSGFPRERVMGMAGVLDSSRLRSFIAEELGVSPTKVEAMTLGSHGEAMVPLPRQATVDDRPLTELVDEATLERLYARTRDAGAEIVALLKKGSAYYAPSAAIAQMVNAIAGDTRGGPAGVRLVYRPVRDRSRVRGCAGSAG
jgi:malate dehydrogenase